MRRLLATVLGLLIAAATAVGGVDPRNSLALAAGPAEVHRIPRLPLRSAWAARASPRLRIPPRPFIAARHKARRSRRGRAPRQDSADCTSDRTTSITTPRSCRLGAMRRSCIPARSRRCSCRTIRSISCRTLAIRARPRCRRRKLPRRATRPSCPRGSSAWPARPNKKRTPASSSVLATPIFAS